MTNILVIEDSKSINNIIKTELSNIGFNVSQAFTLKDAKEFLSQKKYQLIVLDLHLPDGEGSELIANIQSLTTTKVVVLTSEKSDTLRDELFEYGILDYIIKDKNLLYSISEVVKVIQSITTKDKDKILIIDDSTFICKQITTILEPRNYKVTSAFNATTGLDLLYKEEFSLVILDMELPDMHGIKVLAEIRKNRKCLYIPVLVLSGTSTPQIIRDSLKNGANDFLKKPFVFEEFILKVDLWIDYIKKSKALKDKTKELEFVNNHLQELVNKEVQKNREKDKLMFTQSRQAQMGEMIAMIAHQWRQPLNSIGMASNLISFRSKMGKLDNTTVEELTQKINTYIKHLSTTIDDFRNFFKPQKKMESTNFDNIIKKAITLLEHSITQDGIELKIDIKDIKDFIAYENELIQVLLNLLKNAQDVLKDNKIKDPYISIVAYQTTLTIEDNAGGIPQDILPKIFEPYFSTKDKDGTGLGLYMSKVIVTEHFNGEFLVENSKNGAKFTIKL